MKGFQNFSYYTWCTKKQRSKHATIQNVTKIIVNLVRLKKEQKPNMVEIHCFDAVIKLT